jgi:Zn-finger protein
MIVPTEIKSSTGNKILAVEIKTFHQKKIGSTLIRKLVNLRNNQSKTIQQISELTKIPIEITRSYIYYIDRKREKLN